MNHNDYLFAKSGPQFTFLRRFEEMYQNCDDPHGQSKELGRIDYQIVVAVLDRAMRALGGDRPEPKLLDVGCGLGYFTAQMQKLFAKAEVAGCDISTTAVAKARSRVPECRFFPIDLKDRASLPEQSYDVVVALHVLCYFTDDEIDGVVRNLHRLTADGGFVLVGHYLPEQMSFGRYVQSLDDARKLFESRGFAIRIALDITSNMDTTYAGEPVGRNIYFLAHKVAMA
jgi:2-polyprenyl-3-methyl-5-hydroxy-6-metoxy-1,4-benzoquinol methylase